MERPFNQDGAVRDELVRLGGLFKFSLIVETGTYQGVTTRELARLFPDASVVTIECNKELHDKNRADLADCKNIVCHLGSSGEVLRKLAPELSKLTDGHVLFYLDAHWYDHWPVREELNVIGHYWKNRAVIVIDDFRVPGQVDPVYHYDAYMVDGKPQALDWEFVQEEASGCFSKSSPPLVYYNDRSERRPLDPVGKVYILPSDTRGVDQLYSVKRGVNRSTV